MYTSHGHQVSGTVPESMPNALSVARCGGPGLCPECSKQAVRLLKGFPAETHDHDTLDKVNAALIRAVGKNLAQDCIREMQNAGILFRERGESTDARDASAS